MRVVFMGTGDIAIPSFRALAESSFDLVGLVTQPDKPVGRKQILTAPAIKTLALETGVPVVQPNKIKGSEALQQIAEFSADVIVVMAYGQILPSELIEMPSCACINLHASLLPRHRGASCIQAAILAGKDQTGITVMHVTEALDAGDIIVSQSLEIFPNETGGSLHDRLASLAPTALLEAMKGLQSGTAKRTPQNDRLADYAPKLLRHHGELAWQQSAEELERLIRAYEPWPGTYTYFTDSKGKKKRLKIFAGGEKVEMDDSAGTLRLQDGKVFVACGEGGMRLADVQPEGGTRMSAESFAHSGVISDGVIFG